MVGRPKTLDRSHALATALQGYWSEGVHGMSVNEVCRRAKISKPSLYREFGGEDGLMTAVLALYDETVIEGIRQHLKRDLGIRESIRQLFLAFTDSRERPPGCLLAELRLAYDDLGELSQRAVDRVLADYQGMLRAWLRERQAQGELSEGTDVTLATEYLDSQLLLAALQAQRGQCTDGIWRRLDMSLSALSLNERQRG